MPLQRVEQPGGAPLPRRTSLPGDQRISGILREELGLEPTPSLRRLEQQILLQRPELEEPRPPEPVRSAQGATRPSGTTRPGDTVVFLFTDIEASTHRWEGDEEAMAEDLARHDENVRGAVEETQGRVFANTGDGLCAAFPTASAALTAALGSQHALLEEKWRSPVPLRVRMAIHAGAAEPRGGNYVGPTLNRTARLLSLGWAARCFARRPPRISPEITSRPASRSLTWATIAWPTSPGSSGCSRLPIPIFSPPSRRSARPGAGMPSRCGHLLRRTGQGDRGGPWPARRVPPLDVDRGWRQREDPACP